MNIKTVARLLIVPAIVLFLPKQAIGLLEWESIGPFGGDQYKVRISPGDPDTLFALANFAIHRSSDAGLHWEAIHTADMSQASLLALAFDPLDADHLFVASTANGVWESHDQGNTWEEFCDGLPTVEGNEFRYYPVFSIAFDTNGRLFAGLGQLEGHEAPSALVYRYDDALESWLPDDSGIHVTASEMTQNISALLSIDSDTRLWVMVYGAGVYVYENGLWSSRNGDLPSEALLSTFLAHNPVDGYHHLLGTEYNWIYETKDGGQSWSRMPLPEALEGLEVLPLVYSISVDPNNDQFIHVDANDASGSIEQPIFRPQPNQAAGGSGYVSLNGGLEWIECTPFFHLTVDPRETITDNIAPYGPVTRSRIWYRTGGGFHSLEKSEDGALTFQLITNGLRGICVNNVWTHPSPPTPYSKMLFGAAESGLYLRPDDSEFWVYQKSVPDPMHVYTWSFAADPMNSGAAFYSIGYPAWSFTSQRGIYRITLDCFAPDCPPGDQILSDIGVWRVITTPLQQETIYAACQEEGIMVSHDRGNTWSTLSDGLTLPQSITDIVLNQYGEPLFAAGRTSNGDVTAEPRQHWWPSRDEAGGVFHFHPETEQWLKIPGMNFATLDLELDPWDQQTLFAATVQGVYKTVNAGQTWELLTPEALTYDLIIDPRKPDYLYAASNFGVWRSTDGGKQWHELSAGLSQKLIFSLALDSETGILYAGTAGNSIFQLLPEANPEATIAIDPESLDCGVVPVGFSLDTNIIVMNEGEADLIIDAIVPASSAFTLPEFSPPITITPKSQAGLKIRFAPESTGVLESHITFHSNDPISPAFNYAVKGEGREPLPPVPNVKVNDEDGPVSIPHGVPIQITADLSAGDYLGRPSDFWLRLRLPDATDYWYVFGSGWVESNTPLLLTTGPMPNLAEPLLFGLGSLPSGASEVYFAVDDNADSSFDGTWADTASFTVLDAPPVVVVSPTELNFGEVPVGFTKTMYLTIGNSGEQDLLITNMDIDNSAFTLIDSPAFPLSIASQEGINTLVQFSSLQLGEVTGMLTISSNDPVCPSFFVAVYGNGAEAVLPVPVIKANGQNELLTVSEGTIVDITIALSAGDYVGQNAEWWAEADTPFGSYWFGDSGWQLSSTPLMRQMAAVFDIESPLSILRMALPKGVYTFKFNIDDILNATYDEMWADTVSVEVQ